MVRYRAGGCASVSSPSKSTSSSSPLTLIMRMVVSSSHNPQPSSSLASEVGLPMMRVIGPFGTGRFPCCGGVWAPLGRPGAGGMAVGPGSLPSTACASG
eukprot:7251081-Pyramimonas_sp.AAC.2